MTISNRKIAVFQKLIANLATHPNGTLSDAQLKSYWDSSPEELRVALDGLIDDLMLTTAGNSGADNVGATAIAGLTGATVQGIMQALKNKIDSVNPVAGFVSVKDPQFGAKGDGVADDAPAIQAAINSGSGVIYFPKGSYKINTTLNVTNRADNPITFIGEGWSQSGGGSTTTILGNTGGIIIDTTGTQYFSFDNMRLYSDGTMSTPSTIGIFVARSVGSPYAQFHRYTRFTIFLSSIPGATIKGTIGVYNFRGEHFEADLGFIIADSPIIFANSNILSVTSPFQTLSTDGSMTFVSMRQVGMRCWTQAPLQMWDAMNVNCDKCYYSKTLGSLATTAVVLNGNCNNITITGQIEEMDRAIICNDDAKNIKLDVLMPTAISSYVYLAASKVIYDPDFKVVQTAGSQQSMVASGAGSTLYGGKISLFPNQALIATALTLSGTRIEADHVDISSITVAAGSSYTVNNHISDLQGSGVWNPGTVNAGLGITSPSITVTNATPGDFVEVAPPYDLQGVTCTGYVSGGNTVVIRLQNGTAGNVALISGTWKIAVRKAK